MVRFFKLHLLYPVLIFSILLVAYSEAKAELITIDADSYPHLTDISTAFSGVTLSVEGTFLNSNQIYSYEPPDIYTIDHTPTTESRHFGVQRYHPSSGIQYSAAFLPTDGGGPHKFIIEFDQSTDFVEIDYQRQRSYGGFSIGRLQAYNYVGTLIDQYSTERLYGFGDVRTLTVSGSDIFRVVASCYDGWSGSFDNLRYNGESEPVPEPSTMILLGTGLLGLAGWGRRKFKKN